MTSISMLMDLVIGPSSFSLDLTNPNNKKKWEIKTKELDQKSGSNYWLKSLEASLYHTINVNSNSNLNLQLIVAKEVQGLKLEDRLVYYQKRIDIVCSMIFSDVFEGVTKPNSIVLDDVIRKLRWLINETNRIEDDNKQSIFSILKDFNSSPESEYVYVCNYFTAVYLKKSIIALYRQISIIDKETTKDWQDDIFIMKSLVEKFDGSTYSALKDYTFKHMGEDSTYLIDLYSTLKKIYYNSYSSQQNISWSEIDLKVEIRKLENLSFLIVIKDRLVGEKVELGLDEVLEGSETVIDKVYDEIRSELSQLKYPNDRIYLLGQKVNEIKEILEDEFVESNKYLLESIPRKLIRKLQSELEMIMANPKIDLKEFDRDKTKPVKTTVSVTQLAFLFKILEENKIITPENRSDLYMAVCNSFMSKQTDGISPKSFQNHYLATPDNSTKVFWKDKFMEFYNQIKIIK
jgi:hypothetical protein